MAIELTFHIHQSINQFVMKNLFFAAALLLTSMVAAQEPTMGHSAMSLSDMDVFHAQLEMLHHRSQVAEPELPKPSAVGMLNRHINTQLTSTESIVAYLHDQQAAEQEYAGKFYEEMGFLYNAKETRTPKQLALLLTQAYVRQSEINK